MINRSARASPTQTNRNDRPDELKDDRWQARFPCDILRTATFLDWSDVLTAAMDERSIVRARLLEAGDDTLSLGLPGSEYRLTFILNDSTRELSEYVGKRVRGVIEANALRMHPAAGGGKFIEPMWGAPRIVAGRVLAVDSAGRRVLVESAVPMWVTAPDNQNFDVFKEGALVNFHVESGARFTPVQG